MFPDLKALRSAIEQVAALGFSGFDSVEITIRPGYAKLSLCNAYGQHIDTIVKNQSKKSL